MLAPLRRARRGVDARRAIFPLRSNPPYRARSWCALRRAAFGQACRSVRCVERSYHWPGCACCGYRTRAGAPAGAAGTWPLHASSTSPVQTATAPRGARRDAWHGAMATAKTRSARRAERAKSTGSAIRSTVATRRSRAARRGARRPFRLSTAANAPAKRATFALRFTPARTRNPRLKVAMHRHLQQRRSK